MSADDLTKPLGQDRPREPDARPRQRFDLLVVTAGLVCLAAVTLGAWAVLFNDPYGGEPSATVPIESAAPAAEASDAARGPASGGGEIAASPELDLAEIAARVRIIDPETGEIDGPPAPRRESVASLTPAPDIALVEDSAHGPLPRIGEDGRRPADVYARPVVRGAGMPSRRIALVVTGLGLSASLTRDAIDSLPGAVTLAFSPYGDETATLAASARGAGHETLLQVPMEPFDYPDNDPGPRALLTSLSPEQNRDRLHWVLSRFTGYAGLVTEMGAHFTASDGALTPVLAEIGRRGLFLLDRGATSQSRVGAVAEGEGLATERAAGFIAAGADAAEIERRLAEAEAAAEADGAAVIVVEATPVALARLARWAEGLEGRDLLLVPASGTMPRPST